MNSDWCLSKLMVVLELADIFVSNAFNNVFEGALILHKNRATHYTTAPGPSHRILLYTCLIWSRVEIQGVAANGLLLEAVAFWKLAKCWIWNVADITLSSCFNTKESSNIILTFNVTWIPWYITALHSLSVVGWFLRQSKMLHLQSLPKPCPFHQWKWLWQFLHCWTLCLKLIHVDYCGMMLFNRVLPILQMLKEIPISSALLSAW